MSHVLWRLIRYDLPLWICGAIFTIGGLIMIASGAALMMQELNWRDAVTTTGRVIVTEWLEERHQNRVRVNYAYKDEHGAIYHNQGLIARKMGKLNLEPGTLVIVRYRPEDHSRSVLNIEVGSGEWRPLIFLGIPEALAGAFFFYFSVSRLLTWLQLYKHGTVVEGNITQVEAVHSRLKSRSLSRLICEYDPGNGQVYKVKSHPFPASSTATLSVGDKVRVLCLPAKPQVALVDVDERVRPS
jgi:hypothetical protein